MFIMCFLRFNKSYLYFVKKQVRYNTIALINAYSKNNYQIVHLQLYINISYNQNQQISSVKLSSIGFIHTE